MPTGCSKALTETDTPTEWFVDPSNAGNECQGSRLTAFQNHCGVTDGLQCWAADPEVTCPGNMTSVNFVFNQSKTLICKEGREKPGRWVLRKLIFFKLFYFNCETKDSCILVTMIQPYNKVPPPTDRRFGQNSQTLASVL